MSEMDDKDVILDVDNAFSNGDKTVIGWGGDNYYKACGEPVVVKENGGGSTCVKRQDHPGDIHEDYDGVRKAEKSGQMLLVVSFAQPSVSLEDFQRTRAIAQSLKPHFEAESDVSVIWAVNELSDEVLMVLKGDG